MIYSSPRDQLKKQIPRLSIKSAALFFSILALKSPISVVTIPSLILRSSPPTPAAVLSPVSKHCWCHSSSTVPCSSHQQLQIWDNVIYAVMQNLLFISQTQLNFFCFYSLNLSDSKEFPSLRYDNHLKYCLSWTVSNIISTLKIFFLLLLLCRLVHLCCVCVCVVCARMRVCLFWMNKWMKRPVTQVFFLKKKIREKKQLSVVFFFCFF